MTEQEIFVQVLAHSDPAARLACLEEACRGDLALKERVEVLLKAHERAGRFLESPAGGPNETGPFHPQSERPGTVIAGRYKLLEQIGEGGMGAVWVAEQSAPVKRRVALKLIKAGMDTRQVLSRFEAERQALALMDHPNIAKVFDGGMTDEGRPFFVMEYVKGVPITQYCDDARLTVADRLVLFTQVCQAVQHAHQKGIIHRDLKPSNILVCLYDGQPVPKVIDFGLAKAMHQSLTERTLYTAHGLMVGTPLYMSPEQAEFNNLDVDTRTDVYSLGVLLYELLTGSTPLEQRRLKDAAFAEILRLIKEEEPTKPSLKLSGSASLPSIAAQRSVEPAQLSRKIRGDLDCIVMKSLEKERSRRYETAIGLAADVQRYLLDEPIEARPPTLGYRLGKTVRRYKGTAAVAALVLLSLVAGIVGTSWGMYRAGVAKRQAVQAKEEAVLAAGKLAVAVKDLQKTSSDLEQALEDNKQRLFDSLLNEARAWRASGEVGQRSKALATVREAAKIRITPALSDAAAAALVLADVETAQEWEDIPESTGQVATDSTFTRCAELDRTGALTVFSVDKSGRRELLMRLPSRGKPLHGGLLLMSPDGRFVAFPLAGARPSVADGVAVWDLENRSLVMLGDGRIQLSRWAIAFRPDSRQLAIGHPNATISIYDLPSGNRSLQLKGKSAPVHVAFHPSGDRLAAACGRAVHRYRLLDGSELPPLQHSPKVSFIEYVAWHPDGRRLATSCNDYRIHWWDAEASTELEPAWEVHELGIRLAFNYAGDRLVSRGWSAQTCLWDVASGRLILNLAGNYGLQFSADDKLLGPGRIGTRTRLSRIAVGNELCVLALPAGTGTDGHWAPVVHQDGRQVMTFSHGGLSLFDLAGGEQLARAPMPEDSAVPFAYDDRAHGWLTSGRNGLLLWPVVPAKDQRDALLIGPPTEIVSGFRSPYAHGAAFSADFQTFAIGSGRNSTLLVHRGHPDQRLTLGPQNDPRYIAISPDGQWVATGSHHSDGVSKSVFIWDAKTGNRVHELPLVGSTGVRFSPNGKWLVTNNHMGSDLWEVRTWLRAHHFDHYVQTAFTPDSRLLARGDILGAIRLCETETGREVARLAGPKPGWYQVECFTPDGTKLLAGFDGRIYVFDLRAIRQGLVALGLDWDWPPFLPTADSETLPTPLRAKFTAQPGGSDVGRNDP